ncbi:GAF domain-containing sensor histidine kinase [Nocardioides sp. SOB44]|uniref:Sensor-like histidine kinase SenX3 n=1 Tax=Nocardioides cremeus TaxID=3058044 RepID=A0ABT8TLB4_9ACTN|nr:GAF domain-containing sensor histidine kinase [Nocardioides cremeus]MDO3394763.1 GAF domain-containing sensor histidine kinase [Nocardioides cremeus]
MAHERGTASAVDGHAGLADRGTAERALTALRAVTDADLSDLLALAADLTGVEVAALAVADDESFHYPVTVGTDAFTTPYAEALCRRARGVPGLFEVPDTTLDPHLQDSPLVTGERAVVRFYASAPLTTSGGQEVGRFCLFGTRPHQLDEEQRRVLATLAVAANRILELRLRRLAPSQPPTADVVAIAAQISHDLQSPLATLTMSLGMLEGDGLDVPTRSSVLAMASRSVERMRGMVEGTLRLHDLAHEPPRHEVVDLRAQVEQLVCDERDQWERSGGRVDVGLLPTVLGDPAQVSLVLQNLLQNARKFARPGHPPEVAVSATREDDRVRVTVLDNGVGIPVERRARVFDLFARAGDGQGHGIGLATVARIVHAHGGRCGVDDGPAGAGAALWFELPGA